MITKFNLGDEVYVKPNSTEEGFVGTIYSITIAVKDRTPNIYYVVDGLTVPESRLIFRNAAKFNEDWQEWLNSPINKREEKKLIIRNKRV